MSMSISARLKHDGNVNRISELTQRGCSSIEVQACFAQGGITLKIVQGDFPLLANLPEMCRKALSKKIQKEFLLERQQISGEPVTA